MIGSSVAVVIFSTDYYLHRRVDRAHVAMHVRGTTVRTV